MGMKKFLLITLLLVAWSATPAHASGLELTMPVDGPVVRGFDAPAHRYGPGHRGVDIMASPGTPVRAAAQGRVHFAGVVTGRPSVSIDHGNGLRTTYTPVSGSVREGEVVKSGQVIGTLQPGHCTPACLHWGLTDGTDYHDPLPYLTLRRVRLAPMGAMPVVPAALPAATVGVGSVAPGQAPVRGPVTSKFGMRVHPVTGVYKLHDGVDFGAACGTPIHVPWAGEVIKRDTSRGYGLRIHVRHENGLVTAYAHLPRFDVQVGQHLDAGAQVGVVGTTGYSTGCHLHWMAWKGGALVDPLTLLR